MVQSCYHEIFMSISNQYQQNKTLGYLWPAYGNIKHHKKIVMTHLLDSVMS